MMPNDFKKVSEDMLRLRDDVMSRVRTVRRVRAFLTSPMSTATFIMLSLAGGSLFISFADVYTNIMTRAEWGGKFSYTYDALIHAQIVVQLLAALVSVFCLILLSKILFKLRAPAHSFGAYIWRFPFKIFRS